ncbi:MAG: hypothetical protein COV57_00385 [Candidatus Liptonbacteria bacterium CG11_big_fil_rev_8_21_14_0_20_35_14]|uniref:Type II toxin-antitoxin system antitoxin, RelB/DinJ family n=1 Tax=Candidatus Liptonbacteria bacterium CG11_big_fil_rev_8_21_14_0_20_35_14 TaxID=1974634 RepID=A0A2H0NAR0_9BACT|nr:MAG: hypothetical protein COV57_00385 [Candidatus Liptonbacteria bacterium CG11_big_fil_rev_8_21_14_0_20_35_14]
MEKTVLNIKTDKKVKTEAQETARELGLSLSTILNAYLKEFVRKKKVIFLVSPTPNKRLQKLFEKAKINTDEKNKNSVGPFNYKEAIRYLDEL